MDPLHPGAVVEAEGQSPPFTHVESPPIHVTEDGPTDRPEVLALPAAVADADTPIPRQHTNPPSFPTKKGSNGNGKDDLDYAGDEDDNLRNRQWQTSMPSGIVMFLMMFACAMTAIGTGGSQYFGNATVLRIESSGSSTTVVAIPATVHLYLFKAVFVHKDGNERLYSKWYSRGPGRYTAEAYGLSNPTYIIPDTIAEGNIFSEETYTALGNCSKRYDKYSAAFAFSILACVTCFVAGTCALFRICGRKTISKFAVVLTSFIAFAFLVISFSLSISNFAADRCGAESLKSKGFHITFGLALLISAAGLSLISSIWALVSK